MTTLHAMIEANRFHNCRSWDWVVYEPVLTSRTNRTALLTPWTRACVHVARSRDVSTRNTWASTPCRVPDLVPNVRISPTPPTDGCLPEWTSLQLQTHNSTACKAQNPLPWFVMQIDLWRGYRFVGYCLLIYSPWTVNLFIVLWCYQNWLEKSTFSARMSAWRQAGWSMYYWCYIHT